ncbi:MAG: hypothetical protein ACKVOR_09210 [Flavobacteriales bacterium]
MITDKIRKVENLHIVFWLVKDCCWVSDYKTLGVYMIAPTLLISLYITIRFRHSLAELAHNIAVTSWICANSTWMIGEFYFKDTTRPEAKIFFYIGIVVLASYYLWLGMRFLINNGKTLKS